MTDARRRLLWLLPPTALGIALRLWNLPDQVMGGDELHAVRAALAMPLPRILTTYLVNDNSIPLTALDRLALAAGVPLSETLLRLPMLLAGIAALAAVPRLLAGRLHPAVEIALGVLVAISPSLVFYSRFARSYMPMVLCALAAAVAFDAWWRGGPRRAAAAWAVLGALAVWLHLGAAPFVVAPWLFALGEALLAARRRRAANSAGTSSANSAGTFSGDLRRLALAAGGLALALGLLIGPAAPSLVRLLAIKQGESRATLDTVASTLLLQAGTARPWLAAAFWLLAAVGLVRLWRERPRLAAWTATLAAAQLAGVIAMAPAGVAHPLVCNRYLLPALPLVLLWVAAALAWLWQRGRLGLAGRAARLATVGFLALLLACGPFGDPRFRATSFMHHNDLFNFTAPPGALPAPLDPVSPYRLIAAGGRGGAIVEAPWPSAWSFNRSFYVHERVHRRDVLVAPYEDELLDPRLAFRHLVAPEPEAILASRAGWVVVHQNLAREEDLVEHPENLPRRRMPQAMRLEVRTAGQRLARRLERAWGPPDQADRSVRAWDLERVRRARPARSDDGGGSQSAAPAARPSAARAAPATKPGGR